MARSRLVLRMYAFTGALSIAIMVALLVLPRYTRSARYLEPQAALVQFLVDRWSTKNPVDFEQAVHRLEPRLRGRLTVYAHDGRVLSREQLLDLAKGSAELSFDRSIDVHVSRLRAKLGDDSRSPKLLKTVRGAGYLLAGGDP